MTNAQRSAWDAALATIRRLRDAGHQALLAGGCVRDMLLDRKPKDYDVATDATPDRVIKLFPRARKVGAKFGVVLTRKYGFDIEVATFRTDGNYSDGRRPDEVIFGNAQDDANRRDFTINGLFFDPIEKRVIDYVDGQGDLQRRVIRTIGDPDLRFEEDHLRLLRAVRFASALDFTIDEQTSVALRIHAAQLRAISAERIWKELEAMLSAPTRARSWTLLGATQLCDHLVGGWRPERSAHDCIVRRLGFLPDVELDATVGLSAVLLDLSDADTAGVCRALKMSNRHCDSVAWQIRSVRALSEGTEMELADLKTLMAHADWGNALRLWRADLSARGVDSSPYDRIVERTEGIPEDRIAPPHLLTGADLIELGEPPGPRFGQIVKKVYRAQLNEEIDSAHQARNMARRLMDEFG